MSPAPSPPLLPRQYSLRQLVAHLGRARDYSRLFSLFDATEFLVRQAEACGFQQCGEDLEQFALPAAIESGEWERFLHYALVALNLRGLAESLANEPVLRALVQAGRFDLAEDAVARLSDPARRAAARSILASSLGRESEAFTNLIRNVVQDCEEALSPPEAELPETVGASLATVAHELGVELSTVWQDWYERLGSGTKAAVQLAWAVAESYLEAGRVEASEFWKALDSVSSPIHLLEHLPERLGAITGVNPWQVLERLRPMLGSEESFWQVAVRLLGRWAESSPERALTAWESLEVTGTVPWSEAFVGAGAGLFRMLSPERLDSLVASCREPAAHAALRILALAAEPTTERVAAALQAVSSLTQGQERLRWALRYLAVLHGEPEAGHLFGRISRYLHKIQYAIPATDCARYLDLAARFLSSRDLAFELESMVFSPSFGPEALRTVMREVMAEQVLTAILEQAERYAAMIASNERDGFALRAELISLAVRRLCISQRDLTYLESAAERLLLEEEDELRAGLAIDLQRAGLPSLGRQVATGIRALRLRFEIQLQVLEPVDLRDQLRASVLYQSVATIEAVEQELRVLTAQLEEPVYVRKLVEDYILPIQDPGLQLLGLLRLGHHALASLKSPNRQDRAAAVDSVRPGSPISSDDLLVALTPAIAEVGAGRGAQQAVMEFRQAAERVLALGSSWEGRRNALEDLLARLGRVFVSEVEGAPRKSLRRAAAILETVLEQPRVLEPERARDDLRRGWDEVLPLVLASRDRLPKETRRTLEGVSLVWPGWQQWGESAGCPARWRSVLELCQKTPDEWSREATHVLGIGAPESAIIHALVYLLASCEPERVPHLLAKTPSGAERDGYCLRLLRHGWLPASVGRQLLAILSSSDVRSEAELFVIKAPDPDREWLQSLAVFLARVGLDPSHPTSEPLLRRLWREDAQEGRRMLARALLVAMREGGAPRGEAALRVWLHIHLAPQSGVAQPAKLQLGHLALAAVRKARSLSPERS